MLSSVGRGKGVSGKKLREAVQYVKYGREGAEDVSDTQVGEAEKHVKHSGEGAEAIPTPGQVMLKQICDIRVCTYHSFYGTGCQVSPVFQVQLLGIHCMCL